MKNYFILFFTIIIFIGCASNNKVPPKKLDSKDKVFLNEKPVDLQKSFKKLLVEDERNKILNYEKIALDAYQLNYFDISKEYFDKALEGIELIYGENENAREARSIWYEEGRKDYKGEPYERVMAFYYRGLLYMHDQDYENARASFKGAILQDAFAEEDENRCDFNLVILLEAIASKFNGDLDLYEETLKNVKLINPQINIPENFNTVLLIETGNSPRKVSDGVGHYQLKFRRGKKFNESFARVILDGDKYNGQLLEDIYWQSTTRGGRYFDHILKGKAQFKQMTSDMAEGFATLSTATTYLNTGIGSDTLGSVGAGLGIVSGLALISSVNSDARADTRYWNNIPDRVHVVFLDLPMGKHDITIQYLGKDKKVIEELNENKTINIQSNNNLFSFSSRKRLSYTFKK